MAKAKPKKSSPKTSSKKAATKKPAKKSGPKAAPKDLGKIFLEIKGLMIPYQKTLVSRTNNNKSFDLWSEKDVVIMSRPRKEIYFAGVAVQSGYVGFYYMPVYVSDDFKKVFKHLELLKTLKGKSCFHIKNSDPQLMQQIKEALQIGYDIYNEKGWV